MAGADWDRWAADREVAPIVAGLRRRDPQAVAAALSHLEADRRGFRTGYAKERVLSFLPRQELDAAQRARVTALVLRAADLGVQRMGRQYARLVRAFATNELRRELRARMRDTEGTAAWRATWMLCAARRPGLTQDEVVRVRGILRERAGRGPWLSHHVRLLAWRFWSQDWEATLRTLADNGDLGARRLVKDREHQRKTKQWRASGRRESAAPFEEAPSDEQP